MLTNDGFSHQPPLKIRTQEPLMKMRRIAPIMVKDSNFEKEVYSGSSYNFNKDFQGIYEANRPIRVQN